MPGIGHRHALVVYTHTLDLWWRLVFSIGLFLLIIPLGLMYFPYLQTTRQMYALSTNTLWMLAGTGAFTLLAAVFLGTIRHFAYVQPARDHLLLVTPFLRLKISYRRINQATSSHFEGLFPPPYKRSRAAICQRLARYTAILLDLNGLPVSRAALLLFLSPLFFPDHTSRLALFVPDWINFSNELESFRGSWLQDQQSAGTDPRQTLYESIAYGGEER